MACTMCSMEVLFLIFVYSRFCWKEGLSQHEIKNTPTKPKTSEWGNIQVKIYAVVMEFFFVACVDFLVFAPMLNFCIQDLCLHKERSCNEKWQPCHSNERNQGKHNVSNFDYLLSKTWTKMNSWNLKTQVFRMCRHLESSGTLILDLDNFSKHKFSDGHFKLTLTGVVSDHHANLTSKCLPSLQFSCSLSICCNSISANSECIPVIDWQQVATLCYLPVSATVYNYIIHGFSKMYIVGDGVVWQLFSLL